MAAALARSASAGAAQRRAGDDKKGPPLGWMARFLSRSSLVEDLESLGDADDADGSGSDSPAACASTDSGGSLGSSMELEADSEGSRSLRQSGARSQSLRESDAASVSGYRHYASQYALFSFDDDAEEAAATAGGRDETAAQYDVDDGDDGDAEGGACEDGPGAERESSRGGGRGAGADAMEVAEAGSHESAEAEAEAVRADLALIRNGLRGDHDAASPDVADLCAPECDTPSRSLEHFVAHSVSAEARRLVTELPQLRGLRRCAAFRRGITRHRCTLGRLQWLAHWIGDDPRNAQARTRLLARVWNDVSHFRPFTTIEEAARLVESRTNEIVIRLSSTVPGSISVSYCRGKAARHRRFAIKTIRAPASRSDHASSSYLFDDDVEGSGACGIVGYDVDEGRGRGAAAHLITVSGYVGAFNPGRMRGAAARVREVVEDGGAEGGTGGGAGADADCESDADGVGAAFERELPLLYGTCERFDGFITDPATEKMFGSIAELARALCSTASTLPGHAPSAATRQLSASEYRVV